MMEWSEYIEELLSEPDGIDRIRLSFDSGNTIMPIPPIIKASVFLMDKMVKNQGNRQIIVFPERLQTTFIFVLMRVIHHIFVGKIEGHYVPENFIPGEKLKLGNAVVEYLGIEEKNGKQYIELQLSDVDKFSAPIDSLPMFQKTDTRLPISTKQKFNSEKNRIFKDNQNLNKANLQTNLLKNFKTHMTSSVYYISSVAFIKEQLLSLRICDIKVSDLLFIGQTNYDGKITNVGAGQLAGIPAIVLSSDLYAVNSSLECGNPAQSVMIEISNINSILSQLDVLDKLIQKRIPVIFVTDIINSFDLSELVKRGFNIWRWNRDNLSPKLYDVADTIADKRIRNYIKQELQYIKLESNEISEAAKILVENRSASREQSAKVMKVYEILSDILFNILRETVPLSDFECDLVFKKLADCNRYLSDEKNYLSEELFKDYNQVIQDYTDVCSYRHDLPKYRALCNVLYSNSNKKITIVIPEKADKKRIENFWKLWIQKHMLHIDLNVCFPTEYYGISCLNSDITIIVGWLRRAIMRKIIFSYNTESYIVLLYNYENRWKDYAIKKWSESLLYSNNEEIIGSLLSKGHEEIFVSRYEAGIATDAEDIIEDDELEEINLILRENKYKQFVSGSSSGNGENVKAIPVSYVGGFLAFYQTGHKLLSATQIITNNADKIKSVLPEELRAGDFIVVRESGRDIIKDLADIILKNSGKGDLRELASKWKEVVAIELVFMTENEFFQRMAEVGCKKGKSTIKKWIEDEDLIAPESKEDLQYIADISGSEVLKELLDDVFEAANTVRRAHRQAGRIISNRLKEELADVLKNYGNIDPFNFWEPIEIDVQDVGIIKVLKIIDKGNTIYVDPSDTNRLIKE